MIRIVISITIIFISYFLNAIADAIDHAKGAVYLYELWHILKALSYALPFIWILMLCNAPIQLYILILIGLKYWWEYWYKRFRDYHIEDLDDNIKISFICKLWNIRRF